MLTSLDSKQCSARTEKKIKADSIKHDNKLEQHGKLPQVLRVSLET